MGDKRQNIQLELAFMAEVRGEALRRRQQGTESPVAGSEPERPTVKGPPMEAVVERQNLLRALQRVRRNKGKPGPDGMTVAELPGYLKTHWPKLKQQLLSGTYQPQPVKRVLIPKASGGQRPLGIPAVVDRFLQQAVLQVLQPQWDRTWSEHSYGFRPGRSAHQAVAKAQEHVLAGYGVVIDVDLKQFFDQVHQDRLMSKVAERVSDKRILILIRGYLNAGIMDKGLVKAQRRGVPQGSPLSPLLSNLVLDEWDQELERRGHRFVRYADDCNIYVRSERAGQRVMASVRRFLSRKLKLEVNESKSAVARPQQRQFLGFSLTEDEQPQRCIAPAALQRFRQRVRNLTGRHRGASLPQVIEELGEYMQGWKSYFGFCQTPQVLQSQMGWIRHRLRSLLWTQWKTSWNRVDKLRKRGVKRDLARQTAGSPRGPWRISLSPALHLALPNAYFQALGLPPLYP